jgi:superfamily II DNA/RNA helicase
MDQSARMAALEQFRKNEVALLVASDVAARGLDIPDVSHVFNFDVPHHADDYVHRIGRTGRAGRSGAAITIVAPSDQKAVAAIEKLIGQPIPWAEAPAGSPEDEAAMAAEEAAPRRRGDRHGDRHDRHGDRQGRSRDRSERSGQKHGKGGSSKRPQERSERHERQDRQERPDRNDRPDRQDRPERPERHERPGKVASIENARPRRQHQPRPNDDEGDVAQHLPAFLLRPVRVKA